MVFTEKLRLKLIEFNILKSSIKDEHILQHSINVSVTSTLMGKWLGYSKDDIKLLGMAAILHDIGKKPY